MASQEDVRSFRIVGGPSKFDLMLSLFDGNKQPRRTVAFTLEGVKEEIQVSITGVQQEDGSGESWNWSGTLHHETGRAHVKGYYATKGRSGLFNFVVPYTSKWDRGTATFVEALDQEGAQQLEAFLTDLKR